jgi:DNA-directed RNA polymerase subunit omega
MKQPSLDVLMAKVESKYTLVVATAKQARYLMETSNYEGYSKGAKPVSIALEQIAQGKIHVERISE